MRYLIIVTAPLEAETAPDDLHARIAAFHQTLARAGILLDAATLRPSAEGWRIRRDGARSHHVAGPFAAGGGVIAGYALIQAHSHEEALEWSRRFRFPLRAPQGTICPVEIEVRPLAEPDHPQPPAGVTTVSIPPHLDRLANGAFNRSGPHPHPKEPFMNTATTPIPPGMPSITPHLVCADAAAAITFYQRAFGAIELVRVPAPDGRIMHAMLRIGDSPLMLCDECPEYGAVGPLALKGSPVTIHLYVADVDAAVARAIDAGARVTLPVADMFWGDRYGKLEDPFGHHWSIATHLRDLTPDEIAAAAAQAFSA